MACCVSNFYASLQLDLNNGLKCYRFLDLQHMNGIHPQQSRQISSRQNCSLDVKCFLSGSAFDIVPTLPSTICPQRLLIHFPFFMPNSSNTNANNPLFNVSKSNAQRIANDVLNRELTLNELIQLEHRFDANLDWEYVRGIIEDCILEITT